MKRVRHFAGVAAGVLPAALALGAMGGVQDAAGAAQQGTGTMPGPAPAAAARHAGRGFSVKVLHFSAHKYNGVGKRVSKVPANIGCTGTKAFNMAAYPDGNLWGNGWYTKHTSLTCIGTYKPTMLYNKTLCKSINVQISNYPGQFHYWSTKYCGKAGYYYTWTLGIHSSYYNSFDISETSQYDNKSANRVKLP